jgi:hypothetical protein
VQTGQTLAMMRRQNLAGQGISLALPPDSSSPVVLHTLRLATYACSIDYFSLCSVCSFISFSVLVISLFNALYVTLDSLDPAFIKEHKKLTIFRQSGFSFLQTT